jgi:hypothetical protein
MFLTNLPCKLIILIGDFLKPKDLNALVKTASSFANLLGLHLLDCGLTDPKLEILLWAAAKGDEEIISKIPRWDNVHRSGRRAFESCEGTGRPHTRTAQTHQYPSQIKDSMLMTADLHNWIDLLDYLVWRVGANYFEYVDVLIGVPGKEYVLSSYSSGITL